MTLLLDRGADPARYRLLETSVRFGTTPLHRAITSATDSERGPDAVRLLLERGADANAPQTIDGEPHDTPLREVFQHWAIVSRLSQDFLAIKPERLVTVARHLIEYGANVNEGARLMQKNILGSAIETGNREMVRLVLDARARWDADGAQALTWAAPFPEIAALLRERGASETAPDAERERCYKMRAKTETLRRKRWSRASDDEK